MKRFALSVAVALLALISTRSDGSSLPPDMERILKAKQIVIALHREDLPPFVMRNAKGELTGIDVELLRDAAAALGVTARFDRSARTFSEVVEQVVSGKADIAASALFATPKRAVSAAFTDPYWRVKSLYLVNRVALTQSSWSGNIDKALGDAKASIGFFSSGGMNAFLANSFPRATLVPFDAATRWSLYDKIQKGQLTAALIDEIEDAAIRRQQPELGVYVQSVAIPDLARDTAFAVRWSDGQLLRWLNTFIAQKSSDGTLKSMRNRFSRGGDQ